MLSFGFAAGTMWRSIETRKERSEATRLKAFSGSMTVLRGGRRADVIGTAIIGRTRRRTCTLPRPGSVEMRGGCSGYGVNQLAQGPRSGTPR